MHVDTVPMDKDQIEQKFIELEERISLLEDYVYEHKIPYIPKFQEEAHDTSA